MIEMDDYLIDIFSRQDKYPTTSEQAKIHILKFKALKAPTKIFGAMRH